MSSGFLIFDKPAGITSNQAVGYARKAIGVKKVGHAGTLDPMATGTLVMAVGNVTRLIRYIQDLEKEYVATARFGIGTDTLDADGEIVSRQDMSFTLDELEAIVPDFTGRIQQVPPMVSALKHEGRRMHEIARDGENVEREPREVEVHSLEIISMVDGQHPDVTFRAVVGKGTYIRSLADDMAGRVGGPAHLTSLRRTRIGGLRASAGVTLEDLHNWQDYFLSPNSALGHLDGCVVEDEVGLVRNGAPLTSGPLTEMPGGEPFRVVDSDGNLLAVYRLEDGAAKPEVVIPG